jgi:hypothetical protein
MPDRTKAISIKTVLYISKYMPTRLLYTLAGTTDISQTYNLPNSIPLQTFYYMRSTKETFHSRCDVNRWLRRTKFQTSTHTFIIRCPHYPRQNLLKKGCQEPNRFTVLHCDNKKQTQVYNSPLWQQKTTTELPCSRSVTAAQGTIKPNIWFIYINITYMCCSTPKHITKL